jgi:two-component system phosphate regulon sensor histidine kinase PhoR
MPSEKEKKASLLTDDLSSLESYIHDLFNFSPLPICFISPIGVLLEVNPSFEDLAGRKSYELIGEPIEKLFEKSKVDELVKETIERDSVQGKEMLFSPAEGKEIYIQAFTRVRKDEAGDVVGYFLGIFDLTKTKQTEEELKKSQTALMNMLEDTEEAWRTAEEERNKTQEVINSLEDGLLFFNKDKILSLINPQTEKFFGLEKEEAIGKSVSEFFHISGLRPLAALLGRDIEKLFRRELKISENFILEVSTDSLMVKGRIMGYLVVLHDVSREKIVERMKTEFVSISAHQLRTPLSAIKWTLRMLLDGDLGKITAEQREFIEKTYESNERMITLINDLLNVTRIEEGRYLFKTAPYDIVELMGSALNAYRDEAKKRKIKLEFNPPKGEFPKVKMDDEKIKLAFQNLIDNAIKYTPEKGKVTTGLNYDKKEVVVFVKDNGVGVPKDQQGRLFTKFFRGTNVMKRETDGSGLGLFIVKNIIEAHDGKIWFETKEGEGTTFYFSLPY